jgi:hypothetical protein
MRAALHHEASMVASRPYTLWMTSEGPLRTIPMTLYTEQFIVRGAIETRQHRVTDILNDAVQPFLILEEVSLEELGTRELATRADYAQVNLSSILFAVSLQAVEPIRELRTPKIAERALVSIPPFRVIGNVHLLPDRSLRDPVGGPRTPFVPVTDAVFWSDRLGGGRQHAAMVAVNQARAQILAPYPELRAAADLEAGAGPGEAGRMVTPTRLPGAPNGPGPRPPGSF